MPTANRVPAAAMIFFQYKMNLAYHDARYADLYEETHLQRPARLDGPRREELLLHQPAGLRRRRATPGTLPLLRRQYPAHAADDAHLDLCQGRRTASTSICSSAARSTWRSVAGTDVEMVQETDYPWSGKVSITVNPADAEAVRHPRPRARSQRQRALHQHAGGRAGSTRLP